MLTLQQLAADYTTVVRLLRQGERVPFAVGFDRLDPEWVWVLQHHGEIAAVLLASPCHGMVQLLRLEAKSGCERLLPRLLRACVRDCHRRGFTGYMVWMDVERESENRLMAILKRGGAMAMPGLHQCVGGSFEELRKW